MSLLSKLFGKKSSAESNDTTRANTKKDTAQEDAADDIAPELKPALEAFKAGRYDKAIAAATPYAGRLADASRLCAMSYSQTDRYPESFQHWLALFELEPTAHNAVQLASLSVMCGEVERGEAWLIKSSQINHETREQSDVTARTNFLSALVQRGYLVEALPHITWMRDAYAILSITDDTFLYLRGVPAFGMFLEKSLPILRGSQSREAIATWYGALKGKLDKDGEAQLAHWVAQL
ncbi:hypothetical protein G3N59_16810 [Paraburkholderia sp. Ac-20340]|uniref:hypothetical protein n=1 Tax=Paraburkholderia sp. Ac-20340 TaxID=2703888 RepID=UPI00197F828D|nr:hypothetical protein [Paraburkholderia sp. Ac-20340]MBN3855045.1 hypothetical protein [Paraburkholderia sp. Ac-20340]